MASFVMFTNSIVVSLLLYILWYKHHNMDWSYRVGMYCLIFGVSYDAVVGWLQVFLNDFHTGYFGLWLLQGVGMLIISWKYIHDEESTECNRRKTDKGVI